jgi:diguanylate cyclase (GGDEF)-like protein
MQNNADCCVGLMAGSQLVGIITQEALINALSSKTLCLTHDSPIDIAATNIIHTTSSTLLMDFICSIDHADFDHIVITEESGTIRIVHHDAQRRILELGQLDIQNLLPKLSGTPILKESATCLMALEILSHEKTPYVVVINETEPIGIVTRRSLNEAIKRHANLWNLPIADVAQTNFHTANTHDKVAKTLAAMRTDQAEFALVPLKEGKYTAIEYAQLTHAFSLRSNPLAKELTSRPALSSRLDHSMCDPLIERALGDSMNIGVIALSPNLFLQYGNNTAQQLLQFDFADLRQKTPDELLTISPIFKKLFDAVATLNPQTHPVTDLHVEHQFTNRYLVRIAGVWDNGIPNGFIVTIQDSTDIQLAETKLRKLAYYDALTGLPNRSLLFERLSMEIKQSKRNTESFAVVFADLDGFKAVNDVYGHRVGDQLLTEIGERFIDSLRDSDTVARLGGDEFIFILPKAHSITTVNIAISKVLSKIQSPITLDDITLHMSASFGTAIFPTDGTTPEELIECADKRMYSYKKQIYK